MSQLYPDLSLTTFPESVDTSFKTFLDIVATDGPLIKQYNDAMAIGNQVLANQILAQIPSASQKIIKAVDLNRLTQAILAVERFYKTDVQPYIEQLQQEWESKVDDFTFKGVWSSTAQYAVNNFVAYAQEEGNPLYIATATPPIGTLPTNTQYYRKLTVRGMRGEPGAGFAYIGPWDNERDYNADEVVSYDNALYQAVAANIHQNPVDNPTAWAKVLSFAVTAYPIQSTQPTAQNIGELWFDTTATAAPYYYLRSLSNPAQASDIALGKQAYDQNGRLLVGTA